MNNVAFVTLLLCALAIVLATPLAAQEETTWSAIYYVTPKMGMDSQLEEGIKNHIAKFHAKGDQPYIVTAVEMGAGMGEYHLIRANRQLADFDGDDDEADAADWQANVIAHAEGRPTSRLAVALPGLSYAPEGAAGPGEDGGVSWVTYVGIKPGGFGDYLLYRQKLAAASEETKDTVGYNVIAVVNGAEAPAFAEIRGAANWAAFRRVRAREILVEAYGETEGNRLFELGNGAVTKSWSFVARARPDLGYIPSQ